ncbi:MAG: ABC transporter ATP-binding protein [Myxococcales bacterium]|nr:ABC transporter ATP-binding protein [Myxococcales bacterium]
MKGPPPTVLQVAGLGVSFETPEGPLRVVEDVGLHIDAGEAVALVGESGCGKSVTARALLRLLPTPPARVVGDALRIGDADVLTLDTAALRRLRGRAVGFVFQDPMSALNPVYPVGEQIAERLRRHRGMGRAAARARAVELLGQVGIPAPADRARAYPHQLSGGMRQRVVIAIALACDPALLIADEPTTALDVTIQAQLMALLAAQRRARDMALLLITHDLGLVAQWVDRVVVMYAGQVVEQATVDDLFAAPRHPYTRGLLRAVPGATPPGPDGRLWAIPGAVPPPRAFPASCRFADRCPRAQSDCRAAPVPLVDGVRCLHPHLEPLAPPP